MNTQTTPTTTSQIRDMFLNDEIDANETLVLINTISGLGICRGRISDICELHPDNSTGLNYNVRQLYPNAFEPSTYSYMHKILLLFFA